MNKSRLLSVLIFLLGMAVILLVVLPAIPQLFKMM
jgi:hypothetical protein